MKELKNIERRILKDQDLKDIGAYRLLVAMEAALGLCFHIAAKHLKRVPEDYADCFAILGEVGLLPSELSEKLQKMARFPKFTRPHVLEGRLPGP